VQLPQHPAQIPTPDFGLCALDFAANWHGTIFPSEAKPDDRQPGGMRASVVSGSVQQILGGVWSNGILTTGVAQEEITALWCRDADFGDCRW
jgi:hypothetical protein